MGNGYRYMRALFGLIVFLGIIWLVYVGLIADRAMARMKIKRLPAGKIQHLGLIGKQWHYNQDVEIHYVNRRRVPSGPDPIHNRKASTARQLPAGRF